MTNKSTLLKTGLLLSMALVLSTAPSFADSETFTGFTFDFAGSSGNPSLGSSSVPITSFDTSLGTLTEVDLTLVNVVTTGNVNITNNLSTPQHVSGGVVGTVTVTDTASNSVTANPDATITGTTLAGNANQDFPLTSGTTGSGTAVFTTPTNDLSFYESDGSSIGINITSEYDPEILSGGNITTVISPETTGEIQVTYVYTATPVPEPAQTSAYLMGFGLLLLVGRMYLKKQGSLVS